jgi:hypothetical protein
LGEGAGFAFDLRHFDAADDSAGKPKAARRARHMDVLSEKRRAVAKRPNRRVAFLLVPFFSMPLGALGKQRKLTHSYRQEKRKTTERLAAELPPMSRWVRKLPQPTDLFLITK